MRARAPKPGRTSRAAPVQRRMQRSARRASERAPRHLFRVPVFAHFGTQSAQTRCILACTSAWPHELAQLWRPCLCRHSWRAPVGPRQWLLNTQSSAPCRRSQGPHGTVQEARNVCEGGGRWSLTQTGFTCAAVGAICVRGGLMAHGVIRFTAYVCCLSKSTLARPVHLLLHLGSAVALGVHPSVHCVSFE